MREVIETIGKNIAEEERDKKKITVKCTKLITKISYGNSSFYNYGGWFLVEEKIDYVTYITDTGKLLIDLEMIREEFDIDG